MSNLSDNKAVIFTAPQGWGKTFHAAKLKEGLACTNLVDGWCPADGVTPGALHLTNCSPTELADWRKAIDDETLIMQLLALRLAVILCHARRDPDIGGLQLTLDRAKPQEVSLSCRSGWAAAFPQSAHLLNEEVLAWQKTRWSLNLAGL